MEQVKRSFTEREFAVPWGHIAAKIYGSPGQPCVLMVHGTLDNCGSFERLLKYLPTEFLYVCIDLPGHGLSTAFPGGVPLILYNYVYSIKLVLDSLNWASCIYIGHSLGAALGTYFNAIYPKRITKLIALDGILSYPTEKDQLIPTLREYYNLEAYTDDSDRIYTKEEIIHALQFKRKAVLNLAAAEALFQRAVTKVGENQYRYNRDPRMRKSLIPFITMDQQLVFTQALSIPTLLLLQDNGYKQRTLSYINQKNRGSVKLGNFTVISMGGNHDHHNNHPEAVAPYIITFLQSNLNSKL